MNDVHLHKYFVTRKIVATIFSYPECYHKKSFTRFSDSQNVSFLRKFFEKFPVEGSLIQVNSREHLLLSCYLRM